MNAGSNFLAGVALVLCVPVVAQDAAPAAVQDLIGARAAGGEMQLQARGYVHTGTHTGSDRKFSNWWNAATRSCLSVVTKEGHYSSIVTAPLPDCGQPGASPAGADADVPVITVDRHGEGKASFTNGCVATYNARGQRIRYSRDCTRPLLLRADQGMAAHRREQVSGGAEAPPSGYRSGNGQDVPTITVDGYGEGKAGFSNGCVVSYNVKGERIKNTDPCTATMLKRADRSMSAYRREQQAGRSEAPPRGY